MRNTLACYYYQEIGKIKIIITPQKETVNLIT